MANEHTHTHDTCTCCFIMAEGCETFCFILSGLFCFPSCINLFYRVRRVFIDGGFHRVLPFLSFSHSASQDHFWSLQHLRGGQISFIDREKGRKYRPCQGFFSFFRPLLTISSFLWSPKVKEENRGLACVLKETLFLSSFFSTGE